MIQTIQVFAFVFAALFITATPAQAALLEFQIPEKVVTDNKHPDGHFKVEIDGISACSFAATRPSGFVVQRKETVLEFFRPEVDDEVLFGPKVDDCSQGISDSVRQIMKIHAELPTASGIILRESDILAVIMQGDKIVALVGFGSFSISKSGIKGEPQEPVPFVYEVFRDIRLAAWVTNNWTTYTAVNGFFKNYRPQFIVEQIGKWNADAFHNNDRPQFAVGNEVAIESAEFIHGDIRFPFIMPTPVAASGNEVAIETIELSQKGLTVGLTHKAGKQTCFYEYDGDNIPLVNYQSSALISGAGGDVLDCSSAEITSFLDHLLARMSAVWSKPLATELLAEVPTLGQARILLSTSIGERVMRPERGAGNAACVSPLCGDVYGYVQNPFTKSDVGVIQDIQWHPIIKTGPRLGDSSD